MKIHAEILPSERKYYGTEIQLTTEDGRTAQFNVWVNGISDYTPSEREYDIEEDGKFYVHDTETDDRWEYEISDDHFESQTAYKICQKIVEALDGMEV